MMRKCTPSTNRVGARASRTVPYAASPMSTAAASISGSRGQRLSLRSSNSVAGLAKIATARNVRPQMPMSAALCASTSGAVSA